MGAAFHAAAPSARVPVAPPTVTSNLDPSGLTVCPWCQRFLGLRAMILSVGSGSCSIRLVCTIHASASDLSRKPGIRLHLPLRLFISTRNKCPFSGITRYANVYHACQYGIAALALDAVGVSTSR